MRPPAASGKETLRLCLLYGTQEAAINEAKLAKLRDWIPNDDERRENIAEILPPGNAPLTLKSALPQVAAELGQESLFGDSCRAVVVHQLHELFTGSRGKPAPSAAKATKTSKTATVAKKTAKTDHSPDLIDTFLATVRSLLEATPNALLFIAIEDDAKFRLVNERSPLYQGLSQVGEVRRFSSKSLRFELTDAIAARSLPMALEAVTTWRHEDRRAAPAIFRSLVDDVHLLIQASIAQREGPKLTQDADYQRLLFPADLRPNLQTVHEFRRRKYISAVHHYPSIAPLLDALRGLLDIQKALYPKGDELYVPDADYLIDLWLARLLGR